MTARILVIDDNAQLVDNLVEVLESQGAEAVGVDRGEDALARLEAEAFDLVLTDMRMPGMDGLEVLRQIRLRWPSLPVLIMTAYARDSLLDEVQAEGALGILPKPLDLRYLVDVVSRIAPARSRVLLVEDDAELRGRLAEELWERAQVVPLPVGDLASARRVAEGVEVPLAIIDVGLPDGDGTDLGRQLQAKASARPCRVIYMTGPGKELEQVLQSLLETPNVHLLEKPFSPARLLELVREAV